MSVPDRFLNKCGGSHPQTTAAATKVCNSSYDRLTDWRPALAATHITELRSAGVALEWEETCALSENERSRILTLVRPLLGEPTLADLSEIDFRGS